MTKRRVRLTKAGHIIMPPLRSRLPVEKRLQLYHGEISPEAFKKIADASKRCPVCAGRPLLHMRMCMKPEAVAKLRGLS